MTASSCLSSLMQQLPTLNVCSVEERSRVAQKSPETRKA